MLRYKPIQGESATEMADRLHREADILCTDAAMLRQEADMLREEVGWLRMEANLLRKHGYDIPFPPPFTFDFGAIAGLVSMANDRPPFVSLPVIPGGDIESDQKEGVNDGRS